MPRIPRRYSRHPAEYLAARALFLSGHATRRAEDLARRLPTEPPAEAQPWRLDGRTLVRDTDEPIEIRGFNAIPTIRQRLHTYARAAAGGHYLEAIHALTDAEQLARAASPAIREARIRAESARRRAKNEALAASGRKKRTKLAGPRKQKLLREGRALRLKPGFETAEHAVMARWLSLNKKTGYSEGTIRKYLRELDV